ncbi:unnamed protein product [Ambrosiozyma monospora]|uniref:Unnamed protein product n=1 Tax=Ambrosiozyma monospora TaxID=43982 RepID=A0A9W7DFR2_AMBMO|nr:unnamed protein product [Ambrosiozyma monospora]
MGMEFTNTSTKPNADHTYTKEVSRWSENASLRAMMKANCNSILTYASPNQPPVSVDSFLGDYTKPEFGLDDSFLLKTDDLEVSPLFKSGKPIKVLDFACGTGMLAEYLAPYFPAGSQFVGVDLSQSQLDIFDERMKEINSKNQNLDVKLYEYNIADDEFNKENNLKEPVELIEGTFDLIYCSTAYHHFHDVETITKKLKTYLKKSDDAALVILDLYYGDFISKFKGQNNLNTDPEKPDPNNSVAHHGGFSPEMFQHFLTSDKIAFSKVKTGITFKPQQWIPEIGIRVFFNDNSLVDKFIASAPPMRKNEALNLQEYLVSGEMVIAVCWK